MPRTRSNAVLLGEFVGRLEALEEKIAHNCDTNEKNMTNLSTKIGSLEKSVMEWIEQHRTYHTANEEIWGPPTWLKKHKVATALLVAVGISVAAIYGITVDQILTTLKKTMEVVNGITPK